MSPPKQYASLRPERSCCLSGTTLELLSEENKLDLVVDGQHTSTGNTTENVGSGTLEERADTFNSDNLLESIE